jgi:antitoxin (DNA-binding transcriptional repressor) of toxin-antitoxin stability system
MKKTNIRSLHLNTSSIVREVEEGETYVLEKNGVAVAEIKPRDTQPMHRQIPNRDRILARFPQIASDSGSLLEEDRQ